MAIHTVKISDMLVLNGGNDEIITYSLGSCIGVTLYDPVIRLGGMLHCLLPQSKLNPAKAKANPSMFVDSGLITMLDTFKNNGSDPKNLICKVAGGGNFLDKKGFFKTGERNYTILRKVLWKKKIMIKAEDVGGSIPRTMVFYMATGNTAIRSHGKEILL